MTQGGYGSPCKWDGPEILLVSGTGCDVYGVTWQLTGSLYPGSRGCSVA